LVSLQANAPGAVVQIFLTKTDLVNDPKAKVDWVLNVVNPYIKQLRDSSIGFSSGLLQIEQEVICTSVKNASQGNFLSQLLAKILPPTVGAPRILADRLQDDTRKRVMDTIADLTLGTPPKLPTVGMVIPRSWVPFQIFVSAARDQGIDNPAAFAKIFVQKLKYHQQEQLEEEVADEDRSNDVSLHNDENKNKCAVPFLSCIQQMAAGTSTNSSRDILLKNHDEEDMATGGCAYCRKSVLLDRWEFCCDELEKEGIHVARHVSMDVLKLLEAQGDIFTYDGLVFLQLEFVMDIIRPLVDHELDTKMFTKEFEKDMWDFVSSKVPSRPSDYDDLKKGLERLVKTGQLEASVVLPFLFRESKLLRIDYDTVTGMFIHLEVIFSSSYDQNEIEDRSGVDGNHTAGGEQKMCPVASL